MPTSDEPLVARPFLGAEALIWLRFALAASRPCRYTPALAPLFSGPHPMSSSWAKRVSGSPSRAMLKRSPHWWYYAPIAVVVVVCLAGCVRRRMTIRSNPPGALVYVDDYEIGTTPVSTNFTYYGTRKVRLVKDGYETLTVMQPIRAPWYEIPPLDFVSENLIPGELRDRRTLCYQLRPQLVVPREQLLARAEDFRARGQVPAAMAPPVLSSPPPVHALPSSGGASQPLESIPTPPAQPPHTHSHPMQPFVPGAQPMQPSQPQVAPGSSGGTSSWGQPGQPYAHHARARDLYLSFNQQRPIQS